MLYYDNDIHWFTDEYSKSVYEWFTRYNSAYNDRNCEYIKYTSVDLLQWEKNTIVNIPADKKYNEEYVYREDYDCNSFDNINIKSTWSPIDVNFERKVINNWKNNLIIANWFFAHSKVENGKYI